MDPVARWTALGARLVLSVALLAFAGACNRYPKRLEYGRVDSEAMDRRMSYAVYTPPGFSDDERLPVVLFLHGGGDSHASFDKHRIGQRLDEAIAAGRMPRVVVALPDGELGFWRNWRDGSHRYRDWVVREMFPRVIDEYHTLPCPDGCHVMGVSMGGSGTLNLLFRYPNLFESAAILSAPVMTADAMMDFTEQPLVKLFVPVDRIWGEPSRARVEFEDPFLQWQTEDDMPARVYLGWAEGDRQMIVYGSQRLHEVLDERGIDHGWEEFQGGHNWVSWAPVIERSIAFMVGEGAPAPGEPAPSPGR